MSELNKEDYIIVNNERHGVCGGSKLLAGANYHCYFSFWSPKNSSKEDRMCLLKILFDSMAERVEEAHITCRKDRP